RANRVSCCAAPLASPRKSCVTRLNLLSVCFADASTLRQLHHPITQLPQADSEEFSGARLIAAGFLQCRFDAQTLADIHARVWTITRNLNRWRLDKFRRGAIDCGGFRRTQRETALVAQHAFDHAIADPRAIRLQYGAFDDILQLANIAGPRVMAKPLKHGAAQIYIAAVH